MRVAYLINQYPKVSHTFIRREILALERQGVEVIRFALRGWDGDIVDARDRAEQTKTRYTLQAGLLALLSSLPGQILRRPRRFWQALLAALAMSKGAARAWPYHLIYLAHACRLRGWLEAAPVSHLHAHFGTNSAEIAHLLRLLGGPEFSFTVHGSEIADDAKQNAFEHKVGGAKFVVAISAFTRSQLMRHVSPGLWPKINIVHCGLPDSAYGGNDAPLPKNPVFLCIGRLSGEKGHLVLLDGFAQVLKTHPDAQLVIAGDGDLRGLVEARINALGIGPAVRITGWITSDQVRAEIQACHALVQPSFMEGLPVVIMEAMAQRRVVISTYVGGIPELVCPGQTGWLVPAGDSDELARAMGESMKLPTRELQRFGANASARVKARHDIDTEAGKLVALFGQQG